MQEIQKYEAEAETQIIEFQQIEAVASEYAIECDEDAQAAAEALGEIQAKLRVVKDEYEKVKKPVRMTAKAIDDLFRKIRTPLEKSKEYIAAALKRYELNRQAEQAKLLEEASEALEDGDHEEAQGLIVQAQAKDEKLADNLRKRAVRKYRILDFAELPDEFKLEDSAKLNALAKSGSNPPPGVEFYDDITVYSK